MKYTIMLVSTKSRASLIVEGVLYYEQRPGKLYWEQLNGHGDVSLEIGDIIHIITEHR